MQQLQQKKKGKDEEHVKDGCTEVEGDSNAMRIKKKQAKVRGRLKWRKILLTTKDTQGKVVLEKKKKKKKICVIIVAK